MPDLDEGENLWQYTYTVTGSSFAPGAGFTIEFDPNLTILTPFQEPAVPNGWSAYTFEGGLYDVQANEGNTEYVSLTEALIVEFIWLGGSEGPGAQYFDVYNRPNNIHTTGLMTTPVPVPGAIWVLAWQPSAVLAGGKEADPVVTGKVPCKVLTRCGCTSFDPAVEAPALADAAYVEQDAQGMQGLDQGEW